MFKLKLLLKGLLIGAFLLLGSLNAQNSQQVAVATAHPIATQAGLDILQQGGNAFDAAVAITATLAVVEPYSSGLGGGGFWLLHKNDGTEIMIDGREKAPLNASKNMYLDKDGQVIKNASIDGPLAAGIPGVPAAIDHINKKYGKLSLKQNLAPAIEVAKQGFDTDKVYNQLVGFRKKSLSQSRDASRLFLNKSKIIQSELAHTLMLIAEQGHAGFYQGETAKKLISSVQKNGGIWIQKDLDEYQIVEREPLIGYYNGMKIVSVGPPSSGGTTIIGILNMLQSLELQKQDDANKKHFIVETMRRAYRDRAEYLGDSDFVDVPVKKLIHPLYAEGLACSILANRATPSEDLKPVVPIKEGKHTTHFSVMDAQGNYVSATLSINYPFGSGFVAEGTGVLLNDEMDDFVSKAGQANVYGLVGADANSIEPGKRMLSSMSPSFLEKDGKVAIIGTPGGSRIITMVLLGALEFYDNKTAKEIVSLPRFHHQYLPDQIQYEQNALSRNEEMELQWKGHNLKKLKSDYGNMQLIIWDKNKQGFDVASDPRGVGKAQVLQLK